MFDRLNNSVSHGTMRNVDLLQAFADELDSVRRDHPLSGHTADKHHADLAEEARGLVENGEEGCDTEAATEIVVELMDALNEYGPFGSHPGDGSDYGWWGPEEEEEEEA